MKTRMLFSSVLLAIVLGSATPALALDKLTLVLDWFVNPDHAPVIIAQREGFFADEGLDVNIIAPADPSDPPKLVAAGHADLAIDYEPQLHLQVHQGLPLVRVGTLIDTPLSCLMVKADGPVKSIADLKGRKVGYSVAGLEEATLTAMLAHAGLKLSDVQTINVNFSLTPALMTGQVDAVVGAYRNFEVEQMDLAGGKARCFDVEEEGVPAYDELIFVANANTVDRDKVNRFLAAISRATDFILNHPDDAFAAFSAYAPELSDELNTRSWAATLPRFAHSPSALDSSRYARFEAFLNKMGLIDSVLPVAKFAIDPGAAP